MPIITHVVMVNLENTVKMEVMFKLHSPQISQGDDDVVGDLLGEAGLVPVLVLLRNCSISDLLKHCHKVQVCEGHGAAEGIE